MRKNSSICPICAVTARSLTSEPGEAVRIGTLNGATYLGLADRIGSIAAGKNADLFIVKGNPAANIADVENVIVVFKDGVGYDSAKLIDSVKGRYGEY